MKRHVTWLFLSICLASGTAYGGNSQLRATVEAVSGRLLDQRTGQWGEEDVFSPAFAPVNELGTSLLVLVTIDLGASCVIPEPSAEEALAIAPGERRPPSRPAVCDRPPGKVFAELRNGDGSADRRSVPLSAFFAPFDGKLRVPLLFYRRQLCQPIALAVWTSTQKKPQLRRVEFDCRE